MRRRYEKFCIFLAWLFQRRLAYWCAIRVFAHGTAGQYEHQDVSTLTVLEALRRWEQ